MCVYIYIYIYTDIWELLQKPEKPVKSVCLTFYCTLQGSTRDTTPVSDAVRTRTQGTVLVPIS